jgi:hypothetical protein
VKAQVVWRGRQKDYPGAWLFPVLQKSNDRNAVFSRNRCHCVWPRRISNRTPGDNPNDVIGRMWILQVTRAAARSDFSKSSRTFLFGGAVTITTSFIPVLCEPGFSNTVKTPRGILMTILTMPHFSPSVNRRETAACESPNCSAYFVWRTRD